MACGSVRCLLFMAVCFVGIAYILYTPFPEDAVEPHIQMGISLVVAAIFKMCDFQEYIGYKTFPECARDPFNINSFLNIGVSDDNVQVSEELFDGVKVRLYVPRDQTVKSPLPGIIYLHGGGWIIGSTDMYDELTRNLATSLSAVVASVDYRLAPEYPFPVPFEDCLKATKYFMVNAEKFGVDASRIAVSGDSAGGNLAMAVGTKLTKEGQPPRLLGLIYPALQMLDFNTPSYVTYQSIPFVLQKKRMVSFYITYAFGNENGIEKYLENRHVSETLRRAMETKVSIDLLPEKYQKLHVETNTAVDTNLALKVEKTMNNIYLCPLLLDDDELYALPKTYLLTCEYDPLRDDGLMLARRWKDMYFPVTHVHWDGVQHGFFSGGNSNCTKEAVDDFIKYLRAEL
ncbi:arylacetamide deacetylase-like [Mizuhopecten yessoensis]|uniref:Arylacetamide deacetylase n=1 Tax=Mizuhopecten yessoensis TaxID=6573 RepID=A0A210PF69_MIZYE|nr:arylacetamide deacetylase-like [Mizuhopecten yessoensis]OWF35132.1 Arylacetamide deacetylase [Mizuhopecten yessoensis]